MAVAVAVAVAVVEGRGKAGRAVEESSAREEGVEADISIEAEAGDE